MLQHNFEEVDKIALGFAQALSATQLPLEELSKQAMQLALDWVNNVDERKNLYTQHYPKWELLSEDCKFPFKENENYWVASLEGDKFIVEKMKFHNKLDNTFEDYPFKFMDNSRLPATGHYYINPKNATVFNKDFVPFPPRLIAKEEKKDNYKNV